MTSGRFGNLTGLQTVTVEQNVTEMFYPLSNFKSLSYGNTYLYYLTIILDTVLSA